MANYLSAWKAFRRAGNEPDATAEHILAQPTWPRRDGLRVLDIGCGDGHMLGAFLRRLPGTVSQIVLLDPDELMLSEASQQVAMLGLSAEITSSLGDADEEGLELAKIVDVALAIHVAYLLPHVRFRTLVDNWPEDVPLFLVLDSPGSVFSELWRMTAPDFATRAAQVHSFLREEANGGLQVESSEFTTRVANPFSLPAPVQNQVLSLLCYCDYAALPSKKRLAAEGIIARHAESDEITCGCTCYSIRRPRRNDSIPR